MQRPFKTLLAFVLLSVPMGLPGDDDVTVLPLDMSTASAVLPTAAAVELIVLGESPHYSAEVFDLLETIILPTLLRSSSWVYMPETGHATGVVLDAYVRGRVSEDALPISTSRMTGVFYRNVRQENERQENSIRVSAVDANHFPWEFREAVSALGLQDLITAVGPNVFDAQFGSRRGPVLPAEFEDRAHLARAQSTWSRAERPHLQGYLEALAEAIARIRVQEDIFRAEYGTASIELAKELLQFESLSAEYRMTSRHALRERLMVDLTRHGLRKVDLPGIAHVGAFHAERSHSPVFGNFLDGSRMAEVLARDYETYHLLFYALSGYRLNSFHDSSPIEFDNRAIYPDTNLMTYLGAAVEAPSIALFDGLDQSDKRKFGFYNIAPASHWDAMVVFPSVTIRPSLQ